MWWMVLALKALIDYSVSERNLYLDRQQDGSLTTGQEFRPNFEHFLGLLDNPNKPNGIKTVEDLRNFNLQNAHLELPPGM